MYGLYFGNPFWISLTAWTGSLQVEAFSGCCPQTLRMNSRTYFNKQIDALGQGWCFSLCVCLPSSPNTPKQCNISSKDPAPLKVKNQVFWTAIWRHGTICSILAQSVGGITQRGWEGVHLHLGLGVCDEHIGLLMQHGSKSEHSVAKRVVNISSGFRARTAKRVPNDVSEALLCVLVFIPKF